MLKTGYMVCIENVFKELVEQVNAMPGAEGTGVDFFPGTLRSVVEELDARALAGGEVKPLLALVEPFTWQKGISSGEGVLNLRFLIGMPAGDCVKPEDRLEQSFKPVLYPVYEAFLEQVRLSEYFRADRVKHTVLHHFEIGKDVLEGYEGAVFNGRVDVIELKDFEVSVRNKSCGIKNF